MAMSHNSLQLQCENSTTAKEATSKMERQPTWEKIFANHMSHKGLIYKLRQELMQHNSKQPD